MMRFLHISVALSVLWSAACASSAPPKERYVKALNYRLEGNSEAYYNELIELSRDAPDTREGRRARAMLQASDLTAAVAVIGVLSAIAIPNFMKFQSRAKQAEAKANLKSMYVTQKSFQAETDRFCRSFEECAYTPPLGSRYLYFMSPNEVEGGDAASDSAFLRMQASVLLSEMKIEPKVSKQKFVMVAVANLDGDRDLDVWMIDESNQLVNLVNDLD